MSSLATLPLPAESRWPTWCLLSACVVLALCSARPYAGSWNDGSRLASVEALVDQGTWSIDASQFVQPGGRPIYEPTKPTLNETGTLDKLLIEGRFYSDKAPVPALLKAGVYYIAQQLIGLRAEASPRLFCWLLTVVSSGASYVWAVWSLLRVGADLRLPLPHRLLLAGTFAVSTVALVYTRYTNAHAMLLGPVAALLWHQVRLRQAWDAGRRPVGRLVWCGFLVGLAYTMDLGLGPVLLLMTLVWALLACRSVQAACLVGVGALPWFVLHHVLNYRIGGTIGPANAVGSYLFWPGSPFSTENMTGGWKHSPTRLVRYSLGLWLDARGFVWHNVPLVLACLAVVPLLRRRLAYRPELLHGLAWCTATWLLYAVNSSNASGQCCSIRWFVPFLVPSFFTLAVLLQTFPAQARTLAIFAGWGCLLTAQAWWYGPWLAQALPLLWPTAVGSVCHAGYELARSRRIARAVELANSVVATEPSTTRAA